MATYPLNQAQKAALAEIAVRWGDDTVERIRAVLIVPKREMADFELALAALDFGDRDALGYVLGIGRDGGSVPRMGVVSGDWRRSMLFARHRDLREGGR